MTKVVIQPSYGNRDAWRHWEDTLDKEVPFSQGGYRAALSASELATLMAMHPTGRARFWGATGNHDAKMATLETGDVVLFTGQKLVKAVGEVGVNLRSATFADELWDPHADRGSYHNVYSLLNFQPEQIPYEEIWDLPGFNRGDNFMGLRFLNEEKSATVLDGLRIRTATQAERSTQQDRLIGEAIAAGHVVPLEAVNGTHFSYETPAATTLMHRAEAALVTSYRASLKDGGVDVSRLRTPSGVTDLYIRSGSDVEMIEAKSSAHHGYVREALGQLMDYVLHAPQPVTKVAALFPQRPADDDILLLHRYGVDCLHLAEGGDFVRLPATPEERERMQLIWTA